MIPATLTGKAARILGFLSVLASSTARASEADLILPDFRQVTFLGGALRGDQLLMAGIAICVVGLIFGFVQYSNLRKLPVHKSMLEISELIYATCQTYLVTQGKLILILEVLIGAVMVVYFGFLRHLEPLKVIAILLASLLGIAGSYGVAWFGKIGRAHV